MMLLYAILYAINSSSEVVGNEQPLNNCENMNSKSVAITRKSTRNRFKNTVGVHKRALCGCFVNYKSYAKNYTLAINYYVQKSTKNHFFQCCTIEKLTLFLNFSTTLRAIVQFALIENQTTSQRRNHCSKFTMISAYLHYIVQA